MDPQEAKNRIWHYKMDCEGNLWHEGTLFDDPPVLKFFMRKMEKLPDGRFKVICQGETCFIEPEDVPYVVQDIRLVGDQVELIFPGDYRERLDPNTLWVGKENVLYCKTRGGEFEARFNRKPYLELAKKVDFDSQNHQYVLQLGQKAYPIQGVRD